ncbi:DUF4167 domain-containing protein [Rhodovulum euryhalinum]|uniref:Uncharacterized protein DUF4167 n=1 Tax=Rhodovulum euryhalinum TaxID=35805 RepID=A0A4R2KAI7_9RHOB|nr:DUF4167 domain-containing protein [Rhodovulum euryhalinum]TCO70481.1 uncharacterized protein DUF4167 [Rhodovulum euryhalinum]
MRPSKSRSRSKSNRQRSVVNIVNRVFDSSGPEGKVRGTPQQIIDKYNQLARDAHLGNDRVAAENFQQHAEHYTRLLGEAQREMDARRDQQEAMQGRDRPRQDDRPEGGDQQPRRESFADEGGAQRGNGGAEVIDLDGDDGESTLVETPEETPLGTVAERPAETPAEKPRRPRKPRVPKAREGGEGEARAPAAE